MANRFLDEEPGAAAPTATTTNRFAEPEAAPVNRFGGNPNNDPERPTGFVSAFSQGLIRGFRRDAASLKGVVGLLGDAVGLDSGTELLQSAASDLKRAGEASPRGVESITDVNSLGKAATYAGDVLGEGAETLGTSLLGGGVTGGLAKFAARRAVGTVLEKTTEAVAKRAVVGGIVATGTAQETGNTATELYQATGKPQLVPSLLAGGAKGLLESFTPTILAKATGLDELAAHGLQKTILETFKGATKARVAKAVGAGMLTEGSTEGLQEIVDIGARKWVDQNYDALGPEAALRVLDSVAAGALFGGVAAGGISAVGGRTAREESIGLHEWTDLARQGTPTEFGGTRAPVAAGLPGEIQALGTQIADAKTQETSLMKGAEDLARPQEAGGVTTDYSTPGSDPSHVALGFELLPEDLRGVPARNVDDIRMGHLQVALADLVEGEKGLTKVLETPGLDKKSAAQTESQRQQMSGLIHLLSLPAQARTLTADGAGFSALLSENNAERWLNDENLNEMYMALSVDGYGVHLDGTGTRVALRRNDDGSTVFEFPNSYTYAPIVPVLVRADKRLRQSGWYSIAGRNVGKLEQLTNEGLDLGAIHKRQGGEKSRLAMIREATGIAAPDLGPKGGTAGRDEAQGRAILDADSVKFSQWNRVWNTLLQWRERNPTFGPLGAMVDIITHNKSLSHRIISAADDTLKKFMKVGKGQQDAAYDFMHALTKQTYLTEEERRDGVRRWPTEEEYQALVEGRNRGPGLATTPLLKETEQAVSEMRALQDQVFDQWVNHMVERAQQLSDADMRLAQLKGIQKTIDTYRSRPRFPFASIGEYTVEVWAKAEGDKGDSLITARQMESKADQVKVAAEMKEKYGEDSYIIRESRFLGHEKLWSVAPEMVIREMAQQKYMTGIEKKRIEVLEYLANADPTQRKRFLSSMNPKKKSVELQRAFAAWSQTSANALFKARSAPLLGEVMQDVELARRKGKNTNQLGVLQKAMEEQVRHVLDPADDAARIRAMAFNFHLAFVPASAVVNALQPGMVTLPYLSGRYGDVSAFRAIQKAYMDKKSLLMGDFKNSTEPMDRMLTLGIREGKIEEGQATEVAGLAEGMNLKRMLAGSQWDRFMKEVSYYGSYLFSTVEKINRSVTFRAAADLAMRNPNAGYLQDLVSRNPRAAERLSREGYSENEIKGYLAGVDAIERTQFEYATWNRPKMMRGKFGGTVMTFWMFTQGMLHFATHSPGATRYWLTMMAVAGLMGVPGAGDINELVKTIASRLGYQFDPEVAAREYIKTVVNPMLSEHVSEKFQIPADMLLHGFASEGFGLSALGDAIGFPYIPKVDMSRSMSMGRVSPIPPEAFRVGVEYQKALADTTERVAGAAIGPAFALAEAMLWEDKLPLDDFKRWEKAMPRALRGFIRAGRMGAEGGERTRTGAEIVDFDPMEPSHNAELVAMALGFQPARLAKAWDKTIALQDASTYWDTRKAMLLSQLDHSLYMKDKEGQADAKAAIKRFNAQLPEIFQLKRVTGDTISRSMKERARRRLGVERNVPVQKSDRPASQYFNKLYE